MWSDDPARDRQKTTGLWLIREDRGTCLVGDQTSLHSRPRWRRQQAWQPRGGGICCTQRQSPGQPVPCWTPGQALAGSPHQHSPPRPPPAGFLPCRAGHLLKAAFMTMKSALRGRPPNLADPPGAQDSLTSRPIPGLPSPPSPSWTPRFLLALLGQRFSSCP